MSKFTPFYEWLSKQTNRRSPLGDWARDVMRDEAFPKEVASVNAVIEHLRTRQATSAQIATARLAWQTYARDQK